MACVPIAVETYGMCTPIAVETYGMCTPIAVETYGSYGREAQDML